MPEAEQTKISTREVLILDSNIFVAEIGLRSGEASSLKHYLYRRGTQLVVPRCVAEECEKHLTKRAMQKKGHIENNLIWLARFLGNLGGWNGPSDDKIAGRARELAGAPDFAGIVLSETDCLRARSQRRYDLQQPPSHLRPGLVDCIIWEHCLELLAKHDVVFVSKDGDFRGHSESKNLHPILAAEVAEVGEGHCLTFHPNMESLLSDLRQEISPIPKDVVFAFVYEEIATDIRELEAEAGYQSTASGAIEQTFLSTDDARMVEVRLKVQDAWVRPDDGRTAEFRLSGSCHYQLAEESLADLSATEITLLETQSDGSQLAVMGSYVTAAVSIQTGPLPIQPSPTILDTTTDE